MHKATYCCRLVANKNAKRPIEAHIAPIFKEFKDMKEIERIWKNFKNLQEFEPLKKPEYTRNKNKILERKSQYF